MDLLAAEMTARTGKDPGDHYRDLTARIRHALSTRASTRRRRASRRAQLQNLSPEAVKASTLAGEPIIAKLTAPPATMLRSTA